MTTEILIAVGSTLFGGSFGALAVALCAASTTRDQQAEVRRLRAQLRAVQATSAAARVASIDVDLHQRALRAMPKQDRGRWGA